METGLAIGTGLFFPEKTELNDLLQPVFQHMQEKYPNKVLLVRAHQAEMFEANTDIRMVNEKLLEKFLTGEMMALVNQLSQDISNLSENNIE